jgi:hypothetical protein
MPKLTLETFRGTAPRIAPHLLPEGFAQTATNCKLVRGILQALKSPATVLATQAGIQALRKYDATKWLCWTNPVSVVSGIVPGDSDQRIFWTGDGVPKQSNKTLLNLGAATHVVDTANYYRLGVPAPATPPTLTVDGTSPGEYSETRSYVYCWAYRGALGDKTAEFTATVGPRQSVLIKGLDVAPPASFGGVTVKTKFLRKFLFLVDSGTGQYQLMAKLAYNEDTYRDDGDLLKRRVKATAFKAGSAGAPAPAATPTTEAVNAPDDAKNNRYYVYCWVYQLNGVRYRTDASAEATIAGVQETDTVFITGMAASPVNPLPAGATHVRKFIFRKDSGAVYKLVGRVRKAQTQFIDRKKTKRLGKPITHWPIGTAGSPAAPTATIRTDDDSAEVEKETRFYVWTYVTVWGEESAPSPVSDMIDVLPWQAVTVTTDTAAPSGYANITKKRIYRTDRLGTWRLLTNEKDVGATALDVSRDLALATATFDDDVSDEALAEEIPSTDWDTPPDDLHHIVALPSGCVVGLSKNEVIISEPGVPYACPVKYRQTMDFQGVAAAVTANGVVIGTQGTPYLLVGSDPASMSLHRIEAQQACVSARSMVDMGDYAIYASPDGLVAVSGTEARVITADVITRDQWQAYVPSSLQGYLYERTYVGFYNTGSVQGGFMFDPAEPSLVFFDINPTGGYSDPATGHLYLQIGANLQQWDAGAPLTYTWRSPRTLLDTAICPAAARVDADSYPVTFKLYADGVLKHTETVASKRAFRLPGGYRAFAFEYEVSGTPDIRRVAVATSMADLGA